MEKIIIYTNESCGYCKSIKQELEKNNIKFVEKLTLDFKDEWQQVVELTGFSNVPMISFKNNYFAPGRDYNSPVHLVNILENFEEVKSTETRQILERTKTLNYNINIAFTRLEQVLRQIETKLKPEENEHESTS